MKIKSKISILVLGISCLLLTTIVSLSFSDGMKSTANITTHPEKSASDATIAIDGNGELDQFISDENLNGDGSIDSPYIIENYTINASSAHGIDISNTDAHLIIRNCTVAGGFHDNWGILINSSLNVKILNNTLTDNLAGIILLYSNNTMISRNNASYNTGGSGIVLSEFSYYNIISENILTNNHYRGVFISPSSKYNTISKNNMSNNNEAGIYNYKSSNNTISENIINHNFNYGINLYQSSNNTIFGNNISDTIGFGYGIHLSSSSNNNTISGNNASQTSGNGITLTTNSNFNTISDNTVNNNQNGIYLTASSNNTLIENKASENSGNGITLSTNCNFNTVSDNTVNNNDDGIHLSSSSNNNTLIGNTANDNNDNGIYMINYCNLNTISGNTIKNNSGNGIYLYSRNDNNTLFGNTINNNSENGIYLYNVNTNNTISANIIRYNMLHGIWVRMRSDSNTISGNSISYNTQNGIHLRYESNNNTISGNIISYNTQNGTYLEMESNFSRIFDNDIYMNLNFQAFEELDCHHSQWDNGSIGNYWGQDYITKYPLASHNGIIWNTSYEIDGDGLGMDHFPLVRVPRFTDIPGDFSANEGYSGLSISWIVTDLLPTNYTIELDGTEVASATNWTSGLPITFDIPNGKIKGTYNITIIILDEDSNIVQDTIIFTVFDGLLPSFSDAPEDLSTEEGYTGLSLSWIITDTAPATYSIELDGTEVVAATTWTNGTTISYTLPEDLAIGEHNITIIVLDESGNMAQDTVIITITATTPGVGNEFNWEWGVGLGAAGAALFGVYTYKKKKKKKG
ncbi:MAG: NosD domain-containing protein [Promethearchaeota archaeon]